MSVSQSTRRKGDVPDYDRQPTALKFLFFAELWERFSFYGLQSILILYLTTHLNLSRDLSLTIIGAYGTLVYGANVLGGYMADNFLGMRRSIILGAVLIIIGHTTLAFPYDESVFYGLAFIVVGTGFFKVNVSSFLGEFYQQNDPRRDAGFTFFYMGINVGALLATLTVGAAQVNYGWHPAFGLAAIGMIFGLIGFLSGRKYYGNRGMPPRKETLDRPLIMGLSLFNLIVLGSLLLIPVTVFTIKQGNVVEYSLYVFGAIGLGYIFIQLRKVSLEDRKRLLSLVLMYVFVAVFFSMFKQINGLMLLFSEESLNRTIHWPHWISSLLHLDEVFTVPTPWIMGLNAFFIITLGPFVAWFWRALQRFNIILNTPLKIALSLVVTATAFYIFSVSTTLVDETFKVTLWIAVMGYAVLTLGELMVSPVTLSMVTKVSPPAYKSFMMGFYFFSLSTAFYISAMIARKFTPNQPAVGALTSPQDLLTSYDTTFVFLSKYGFLTAIVLLAITPFVRKVFNRYE